MEQFLPRILAFVIDNPFPQVAACNPGTNGCSSPITNILNIVYAIVGSLALLFVVIGGFKYVISRGDPQATAQAKSTILYAVIGLAVVLSAAVITNFVVGQI